MSSHGPDATAFDAASEATLSPVRYADTQAFMFESRYVIQPTPYALECEQRQRDYMACWQGLARRFDGTP